MKNLLYLVALVFALSACAGSSPTHTSDTFAYESHCREHARDMYAEDSEERRYQECMALHGYSSASETDEHLAGGAH